MSEEDKKAIAAAINKMVAKTFKAYLAVFMTLIVVIFGWHEVRLSQLSSRITETTIQNSQEFGDLKNDFGNAAGALYKLYPDEIIFETNFDRYVLKRGGKDGRN